MIVKCSFGRVPLQPFGWDVMEAASLDIMEFVGSYGQALFDAAEGEEPDFSGVKPELVIRLTRQCTSVEIPDELTVVDTLRLADAFYALNELDQLGKVMRRSLEMQRAAIQTQLSRRR